MVSGVHEMTLGGHKDAKNKKIDYLLNMPKKSLARPILI